MYISSLNKKPRLIRTILISLVIFCLLIVFSVRFIFIAAPFVESKARYIAIDIINTQVARYLDNNPEIFTDIIKISTAASGELSSAIINTQNLNYAKAGLSTLMNEALSNGKAYKVRVPVANLLGITMLSGIGTPVTITMKPVSRVLIDFENNFYAEGINQTHLLLSLKVKVTVMAMIPGLRRSVSVETDIPVAESVFMGDVPMYYSAGTELPLAIKSN